MAWACASLVFKNMPLMQSIASSAIPLCDEFGAQELGNTSWAFATRCVLHRPLISALSSQAINIRSALGVRELGLLADMIPSCRAQILPPLLLAAGDLSHQVLVARACGDGGWRPTAETLDVGGFGAFGTRALLDGVGISQLQGRPPAHVPGWATSMENSKLGPGAVLCAVIYNLAKSQAEVSGSLLRQNGAAGSTTLSSEARGMHLLRATPLPGSPVDRTACAEFRALSEVATCAAKMQGCGPVTGSVQLYVTEPPCLSCVGVLVQLSDMLPQVILSTSIDGALLRYALELQRSPPQRNMTDIPHLAERPPRPRRSKGTVSRERSCSMPSSFWDLVDEDLAGRSR